MWSVENGVVICSSSKDYELQSWNEQGEITKIEGMLTLCFSYISSCSHTDSRKQLYLIMKIPYRVSMSTEQKIEPKKVLQPVNLLKTFHEQRDEIEKLKTKIDVLEKANAIYENKIVELESKLDVVIDQNKEQKKEIERLKKEKYQLKILCGKADRGWRQELNWVYHYDPDTSEPIGYDCPYDFSYDEVTSIRYYLKEGEEWCNFWHGDRIPPYKMPKDAFLWLKGELPGQKKKKNKKFKIQKLGFKEKDDVIEYLENYYINSDKNIPGLKYLEKAINYLWIYKDKRDKDKKFGTGDFRKNLDFCSPGTVDSYLDMFVECDIIIRLGKGSYRVNFE